MTARETRINNLIAKVANEIAEKDITWQMAYDAMYAMKFFHNWDDDELYHRPVDTTEIAECVYEYYFH